MINDRVERIGGNWSLGSSEGDHPAILVFKDRDTGAMLSDVVLERGTDSNVVHFIVEHIVWLGHLAGAL